MAKVQNDRSLDQWLNPSSGELLLLEPHRAISAQNIAWGMSSCREGFLHKVHEVMILLYYFFYSLLQVHEVDLVHLVHFVHLPPNCTRSISVVIVLPPGCWGQLTEPLAVHLAFFLPCFDLELLFCPPERTFD